MRELPTQLESGSDVRDGGDCSAAYCERARNWPLVSSFSKSVLIG